MTPKKICDQANTFINARTVNRYERHVPYGDIMEHLGTMGLAPPNPEEVPFALCGHNGETNIVLVHPEHPEREFWLHLTWHRMSSGNFETVAYLQSIRLGRLSSQRGRG